MTWGRHHSQQIKDITDEIIKGIQNGSMFVDRIDCQWDKTIQRYIVEIVDVQRSQALTAMTAATIANPAFSSVPMWPPKPVKPVIEDLGTITEPVIGYRDFYLGSGPQFPQPGLVSRNKAPWPMREPMRAFCRAGALSEHDAPHVDCECGIYAFSTPDQSGMLTGASVVWGEIAMWGEVLIAEKGYRSEYAYPKTLFVQDTGTKAIRWLRDHLADGYGVPVLLVEKREGKTATEVISELIERGI